MGEQRRGTAIAMSDDERDEFLQNQPVCRVATVGSGGPHLSALWYVWDGKALCSTPWSVASVGPTSIAMRGLL